MWTHPSKATTASKPKCSLIRGGVSSEGSLDVFSINGSQKMCSQESRERGPLMIVVNLRDHCFIINRVYLCQFIHPDIHFLHFKIQCVPLLRGHTSDMVIFLPQ